MKNFKKGFIFLLCFLAIERFCYFQTEGFSPPKIISNLSYNKDWDIPSSLEESAVDEILSQSFHFLGSGKQCYAFESQDRKYVLKFIKQSRKRSIPWLENISFFQSFLAKRKERLNGIVSSMKIAATTLQKETAVVYTHLTPKIEKKVPLKDKIGIYHTLSLHSTQFVIQKKVEPLTTGPFSQTSVDQLISLIYAQCAKGIANRDCMIPRNFGMLEGQAVVLDIGSFQRQEDLGIPAYRQREIFIELLPLREHLKNHHPELMPYFDCQYQLN